MEKFDIEAYLDGKLEREALNAFQQEMRENAAFAQRVEQQRKIRQHLRTQLLREHVAASISAQPRANVFRRWPLLLSLGGILLIVLAVYLFVFQKAPNTALPTNDIKQEKQPAPAPEQVPANPVLEQPTPPRSSQPIADNRSSRLRPPYYPAPNIRGQQDENTAWKKTLDQLWYTQFPPQNTRFNADFSASAQLLTARDFPAAFVALETLELQQPENDTLRLLKAYCLLEMGEGAEALRYFDQLDGRVPQWDAYLEWHKTLSILTIGEQKKALPKFRKMANTPGHPFQKQSLRALEVLK
jgi:hypothetical protein